MQAPRGHRILVSNPGGERVVLGGQAKCYVIVPLEGILEIHYAGKYLGESISLSGAEKFIERGGGDAPVLIKNPNGTYKMHTYKSPKKNPKKKREIRIIYKK